MPFFRQLATRLKSTTGSKTYTYIGMPAAVSENPVHPHYFGKYSIHIKKRPGDPGSTIDYEWTAVPISVKHTGDHRKLRLKVTCIVGDPPLGILSRLRLVLRRLLYLFSSETAAEGDVIDVDVTVSNPDSPVPPGSVGIVVTEGDP